MTLMWFVICCVGGYLIGSLNYSIIFSRTFMDNDVRSNGSGNAGSTNMFRTYGWKAGVITLVSDFMKAFFVTTLTWSVFTVYSPMYVRAGVAGAGLCCLIGHCFPCYFGFKGGKGVAVGAISALLIDWRCFLIILAVFIIIVVITRYVSLGSMLGAVALPISYFCFMNKSDLSDRIAFVFTLLIAVFIVVLHWSNIKRLLMGKESKFSFKK